MSKEYSIIVRINEQRLYLFCGEQLTKSYVISTSCFGVGSQSGSNKTPLGKHLICAKIGHNKPIGANFKSRRFTGKIIPILQNKPKTECDGDFITTRILRLKGMEDGINKGKGIDSYERYVYIHGTPREYSIGTPISHGCVCMKNRDIIELFNTVKRGTLVDIKL